MGKERVGDREWGQRKVRTETRDLEKWDSGEVESCGDRAVDSGVNLLFSYYCFIHMYTQAYTGALAHACRLFDHAPFTQRACHGRRHYRAIWSVSHSVVARESSANGNDFLKCSSLV